MRNLKELSTILSSIYLLNLTGKKDEIDKIIEYAFRRIFNNNTNYLIYCCVEKSKEEILEIVKAGLKQYTKFDVEEL